MWVLVENGDTVVVPTPAYPIHRVAPALAGATVVTPPAEGGVEAIAAAVRAHRPKVVIVSFPHNPTTAVATAADLQQLVDLAREHDFLLVHDFAYADIAFDGHKPQSILAAEGAEDCAVELYSLTKSFSMAGWRVGFVVGRTDVVAALTKLKSYLDYGTFQPIQIASIVALREASDYPAEVCEIYAGRRDALCNGLARAGWPVEPPLGTMFVWAPIPNGSASSARSNSRRSWPARHTSRRAPESASATAATATSSLRSSRTSSASARRPERSRACSAIAPGPRAWRGPEQIRPFPSS